MTGKATLLTIPIGKLKPDPEQPRKHFDPDEHKGLVASVKAQGIISPIAVSKNGDGYTIVAGERRWRAAKAAGLKEMPAIVLDGDTLALATAENVTRIDLNAIEEGDAYRQMLDTLKTPKAIAKIVGKPVERVEERIALAGLPEKVREGIAAGTCTLPAARVLLKIAAISPALAEAVARSGSSRQIADGPSNLIRRLYDDGGPTEPCPKCEGVGWLDGKGKPATEDTEDDYECGTCGGRGDVTTPDADLPFLIPAGGRIDAATIEYVASHLPDAEDGENADGPGNKLMGAWLDYAERIQQTGLGQYEFNAPTLHDAIDAARSYGCYFNPSDLGEGHGHGHGPGYLTDPAFVAEYVPDALTAAAKDAEAARKRRGRADKPDATGDDKADKEARRKEREKADKQRAAAESFNLDLGAVLATKLAAPKVTAKAMKLIVGALLDNIVAERQGWGNDRHRPMGLAMYRRFTQEPPARDKKGRAKWPRKAEAVEQAVEQIERELKQAKTAEEVLGVALRLLATGAFVKLDGLPKADSEGCHAIAFYREKEAEEVLRPLLPPAMREKAPKKNGGWDWND